ncbi:hypothetical protein [Micromonospora sp. NPDC048830]|uniref:hypothetical protein n=1 Tax=Micromonospora sp. NPDC048830 TaxID=3364257 RepID=UPI003713D3AA
MTSRFRLTSTHRATFGPPAAVPDPGGPRLTLGHATEQVTKKRYIVKPALAPETVPTSFD